MRASTETKLSGSNLQQDVCTQSYSWQCLAPCLPTSLSTPSNSHVPKPTYQHTPYQHTNNRWERL